jgi:glutamate 5-kinase
VLDPSGEEIVRGVALYDSRETAMIMGRHSDEIDGILGYTNGTTVIHRNDMVHAKSLAEKGYRNGHT